MNIIKRLCILIVVLFLGIPVFALELKEGRIKLVLHETTGRFSAYYLTDVRRNRYTSFLLDDDPRTTVLSILQGNNVYRMGESADFKQSVQKTADGADFIWKSSSLEIRQSFKIITSSGAGLANGFSVTVTIKNTSESPLSVGMRYLFDTYLGENDNTHFFTPTRTAIQQETDFTGSIPDYWASSASEKEPVALQCMTKGIGITRPDRLVLANWKRLNDSSWNYDSRSSRNFNLLPYSINDSSVGMYYNPVEIPRGGDRSITMAFGNYNDKGFSLEEKTGEDISELYTQTMEADLGGVDPAEQARTDLLSIEDLLKRIDELITSGQDIPQEQVDAVAQIVETLENRKNRHEEQR